MSADDLVHTPLKHGNVHWKRETNGSGNVVKRTRGDQLIEKPYSLLCEGKDGTSMGWPPFNSGHLTGTRHVAAQSLFEQSALFWRESRPPDSKITPHKTLLLSHD